MDHEKVMICEPFEGQEMVKTVRSSMATDHFRDASEHAPDRGSDSVLNEFGMNAKRREEEKKFFKDVAGILTQYDEIVILGAHVFISAFRHFLEDDKRFEKKSVAFKVSDKVTPNQFRDEIKQFFETDVAHRRIKF